MENPFEEIDKRLSRIENLILKLLNQNSAQPAISNKLKRYTLPEAAEYLRMSESTLYQYRPEIGGCKLGRRWIFTEDELNRFLEKKRSKPLSELKQS